MLIIKKTRVPPRLPAKSTIDSLKRHLDNSTLPYSDVKSHNNNPIDIKETECLFMNSCK